jgi:membrane fusion protein (multidrug efflux system)
VVPQKATFEVVEKRYVYVVDDKGVVDAREVVIDNEVPQLFVIKSGLSEKDTVVMEGIGKLSKGKTIKAKLLEKDDVMKGLELHAE